MKRICQIQYLSFIAVALIRVVAARSEAWTGVVTEIGAGQLLVRFPAMPEHRPFDVPFNADWIFTAVDVDDANEAGFFERPGRLSDVAPGQLVTIDADAGFARHVRVRTPLTTHGVILAIDAASLQLGIGDSKKMERFAIDRTHLQITGNLFEQGPRIKLQPQDMRVGQMVRVVNKRGRIYALEIQPTTPIVGAVQSLSSGVIIVCPRTGENRLFRVVPATRFFNVYFGEPPEQSLATEVRTGQVVSVTADGDVARAVVTNYPAAVGKVVALDATGLSIRSGEDSDPHPLIRHYKVASSTKIFMGVARFTMPSPRGGTQTFYDYLPGRALQQIHAGDRVSITAKGQLALSMRVTPATQQPVK